MNRRTQMAGVRLGLTYAAAIVLLALLVAMVGGAGAGDAASKSGLSGVAGAPVHRPGRAVFSPVDAARFGFTAAPARSVPPSHVLATAEPQS
jgi:hypothetical protein